MIDKPVLRGISSEDVAISILEELGYVVLERRKQIASGEVKVGEIDIVAKDPEDNVFAVEVKSGKASVTDVRQIFSNSKLLNAKPLLMCKGFSDASAISLTSELGVRYILLPEYCLFTLEDFKQVAEEIAYSVLNTYFSISADGIPKEAEEIVEAIASSGSFSETAARLSISEEELGHIIKKSGIFKTGDRHAFNNLRLQALIMMDKLNENRRITNIERKIDVLESKIEALKHCCESSE
ncbi:MAG: YraN family protein [Thermoproteota archaeon]